MLQCRRNFLCDNLLGARSVKHGQHSLFLVVGEHVLGVLVVSFEAFAEGDLIVVAALFQWFASHIVLAGHFRRRKLDVVGAARGAVGETAGNAAHEQFVVDAKLKGARHLFLLLVEHVVERHGLARGARKAVQQKALGAGRLRELGLDETNDEIVRHELASLHERLGLFAEVSAVLHGGPKQITGAQMADGILFLENLGLRALAGACTTRNETKKKIFFSKTTTFDSMAYREVR